MKKIYFLLILTTALFAKTAYAASITAGPLNISYPGSGALFAESNLYPDHYISKDITVKNNGTVTHSFAIATRNVTGDVAKKIQITPSVLGSEVWTMSVYDLANIPGQSKTVTTITSGATKIVTIKAYFSPSTGNGTQNVTTSFDMVYGTEETEPTSGFGTLSISPTATPSETPSVTPTQTATPAAGEVKGESVSNDNGGFDPWLLVIVPSALLFSAILLPEFALAGGIVAVTGGVTYILGYRSAGDMSATLFIALLILEIILFIVASYFLMHHDNRASRRIRNHRFRLKRRQ